MGEHTLTIKEWAGTGTPDLKIEWKAAGTGTQNTPSGPIEKLQITRKSDSHSSRFAMMANLNKSNHTLSWGFPEAVLIMDMPAAGAKYLERTVTVYSGVAVGDFAYLADKEETITLYAARNPTTLHFP
jgi:hypothetical protein